MSPVEVPDRVAVVIGGATGIGASVCETLAQAGVGHIVIGYSKSADQAQTVANTLQTRGAHAETIRADVSDSDSVHALFRSVDENYGRLDHLVNSAGATDLVTFDDLNALTPDVWNRAMTTNLMGTFWCCRSATPLLRESRGSIVNIGSIAATRGVGSSIAYGVSKAGVLQLTRSLAIALAPEVRVNSVSAGTVRSGWHEKLVGVGVFAERAETEEKLVPLGRLADPQDIAAAVVALLSLEFVTGQDLLVDGGKGLRY